MQLAAAFLAGIGPSILAPRTNKVVSSDQLRASVVRMRFHQFCGSFLPQLELRDEFIDTQTGELCCVRHQRHQCICFSLQKNRVARFA